MRMSLVSCSLRSWGSALQSLLLTKIRFASQHPVAVLTFSLMNRSLERLFNIYSFKSPLRATLHYKRGLSRLYTFCQFVRFISLVNYIKRRYSLELSPL
jgi:hypothetical protein